MGDPDYAVTALSMMDLRHAGWNRPPMPRVCIVESPSSDDLLQECQEGVALHAALQQARIPSRYYLATNKEAFNRALEYVAMQRHFGQQAIALHISCHGNESGIALTSGERFSWDELRAVLTDFGLKSGTLLGPEKVSSLILCMSTCFGLAAHHMSDNGERPFMTLVAPCRPASWSDTLASFLAFYNLFLLKKNSCGDAVAVMNAVAGERDLFQAVDFSREVFSFVTTQV